MLLVVAIRCPQLGFVGTRLESGYLRLNALRFLLPRVAPALVLVTPLSYIIDTVYYMFVPIGVSIFFIYCYVGRLCPVEVFESTVVLLHFFNI